MKKKRNIIYLNNAPYEITFPTGGVDWDDKEGNDWDRILKVYPRLINRHNKIGVGSWCLEQEKPGSNKRIFRGHSFLYGRGSAHETTQCDYIGWRPMLIPLNSDTLKFDPEIFSLLNGRKIKLGTLIVNDEIVSAPYDFINGSINRVVLGDDIAYDNKLIDWVVFDGKLIALKNLLINVSWLHLEQMGFVIREDSDVPVVDNTIRGTSLGDGYLLMTVPASLSEEEQQELSFDEENYMAQIGIKESFLQEYVKGTAYTSLSDFLQNYDPSFLVTLETLALQHGALAFSYRPDLDNKLVLPKKVDDTILRVLRTFLNNFD